MDRRATLASLLGKSASTKKLFSTSAPPVLSGLEAYSGPWEYAQAAHLLRRAMFGPTYAQIKKAVDDGMATTLSQLFNVQYPTQGPLHPGGILRGVRLTPINDPSTPTGSPWVFKEDGQWKAGNYDRSDVTNLQLVQNVRRLSLRSWKMEHIMKESVSILEKMTLFWHNHFVTADTNEPIYEFRYITTLQENALGNFRELVKKVTLDPAMMFYLNGNENSNAAPNENYARELFELFSIGKGPLAGPGDYTNYTEQDIQAAARVLTGWRVVGGRNLPLDDQGRIILENDSLVRYFSALHDRGVKEFSARFDNAQISNGQENEYLQLIDMIFQKEECARFICRKLYRWFVYYTIDDSTEINVIEPMAQMLITNDYNIQPVLEALLGSQHFFDRLNTGPMIKNPIDFVASTVKSFEFIEKEPAGLPEKNVFYLGIASFFEEMQMVYFSPPDVAGWKAYYQEPAFYRTWINSSTLIARSKFTTQFATGIGDNGRPSPFNLDVLAFTAKIDNPLDAVSVIEEFSKILFPREITAEQKEYLKEVLLPGLPDYEWTIEYSQYLANPDDNDLKEAIETKLRVLVNTMLSLPEFYLS